MKDKMKESDLKLYITDITKELKRDNKFLNHKDVVIFNSSALPINSKHYLVASRGWYGNVRSWDGYNFIILTVMTTKFKKIKQNILEIDTDIVKEKLKFKTFKRKIVVHEKQVLEGPEDPRLYEYKGDIYILINELYYQSEDVKKPRFMHTAKIDLKNLTYSEKETLCKLHSTAFEKNWGSFIYKKQLYMLYDINPLKVLKVHNNKDCSIYINRNDIFIRKIENSFGNELKFHMRNSTNLIPFGNKLLGMGHAVLDYKDNVNLNKLLIPSIDKSDYSRSDKEYFKKMYKLYLGFFFILDMKKKEISKLSPFFQLPKKGSKEELIFFPTSLNHVKDDIMITYSIGDNSSFVFKINKELVRMSLYDKRKIEMNTNYGINVRFIQELIINMRNMYNYDIDNYMKYEEV